jgi:putative ABC transport system substrate-binding protein
MITITNKILFSSIIILTMIALVACADESERPKRIGIVNSVDQIGLPIIAVFQANMIELGYVEGETVEYNIRTFALGDNEPVTIAIQEMVAEPVDLIVALGAPAADAAQEATTENNIPVLFMVNDPIASGYVENLRQPGGNMSGITAGAVAADSDGRRLEWLLKIKPDIDRVYVTHNPNDPGMIRNLEFFQTAAAAQGVEVVVDALNSQEEVDVAMTNLPEDIEVFFLLSDRRIVPHLPTIIAQSIERKFIFSAPELGITRAGALMAFAADFGSGGVRLAGLADQVLNGTDPGNLPVEEPDIVLNVNLKTAAALGLQIPDDVLVAAFEIIRE